MKVENTDKIIIFLFILIIIIFLFVAYYLVTLRTESMDCINNPVNYTLNYIQENNKNVICSCYNPTSKTLVIE